MLISQRWLLIKLEVVHNVGVDYGIVHLEVIVDMEGVAGNLGEVFAHEYGDVEG